MLSGVILTKNEENNIQDALDCLAFADEIIIIDDFSTDRTLEIVKKNSDPKIKVHKKHLESFSQQRNFALQVAKTDYVLFLDADERITKELQQEIISALKRNHSTQAWMLKRQDTLWGRKLEYGETAGIRLTRLGKRNAGKWVGDVHEEWQFKGDVGELQSPLHHYPHQTISEFITEINNYTDMRAVELFKNGEKVSTLEILAYPIGKFLSGYVFKHGYKDGAPGFILASMMSLHSFLVRGKLWQLWEKK